MDIELHWLLDILQHIDVGVVVLDRQYQVSLWNGFMANHSGLDADEAVDKNLFELFPELDQEWFRAKVESVATLEVRAFTIWEQRPYLLRFKGYQPITGQADFMYQNATFLPVKGRSGQVSHVALIIYDVTHEALHKQPAAGAQ